MFHIASFDFTLCKQMSVFFILLEFLFLNIMYSLLLTIVISFFEKLHFEKYYRSLYNSTHVQNFLSQTLFSFNLLFYERKFLFSTCHSLLYKFLLSYISLYFFWIIGLHDSPRRGKKTRINWKKLSDWVKVLVLNRMRKHSELFFTFMQSFCTAWMNLQNH